MSETPETREAALQQVDECPYCNRTGQVMIFHPNYDGQPMVELINRHGEPYKTLARCVAHCVCPVGRWMRSKTEPDLSRRIPDLAAILEGRMQWLLKDPTTPDLPDGCYEGMSFAEFWNVIKRPGQGPIHVSPSLQADARKRQRENWLVRFLVCALERGPLDFNELVKRAADSGRNNVAELRAAAELARIAIARNDGQETWSLE